ncbi:MAG: hypothetical protein M1828_005998 [Chrysothrix sp. TS-e1954]|nr:MAG: hypothetical protein M1828_005998 [Chrysothrix sp. TS-e1954]
MDRRRRSPSGGRKKTGFFANVFSSRKSKSSEKNQTSATRSPERYVSERRPALAARPAASSLPTRTPLAPGVGIPNTSAMSSQAPTYTYVGGVDLPSPPNSLQSPSSQDPVDAAYRSDLRLPPIQRSHRRHQSSSSSVNPPLPSYSAQSRVPNTPPYTPRTSWGRPPTGRQSGQPTYHTSNPTDLIASLLPAAPEAPQPQYDAAERTRAQGREEQRRRHREKRDRPETRPQPSQTELERKLNETMEQLKKARHDLRKYEDREREMEERLSKLEDGEARRSERRHRHRHKTDEDPKEKSSRQLERRNLRSQRQVPRRTRSSSSDADKRTLDQSSQARDYIRHRQDDSLSRIEQEQPSSSRPRNVTMSRSSSQRQSQVTRAPPSENAKRIAETRASVETLRAQAEAQKQNIKQQQSRNALQPTVEEVTSDSSDSEKQPRASKSRAKSRATTASTSRRQQTPAPPPRGQSYYKGHGEYIQTERQPERVRPSQPRLRRTVHSVDRQNEDTASRSFNERMKRVGSHEPTSHAYQDVEGHVEEAEETELEDEPSPGVGTAPSAFSSDSDDEEDGLPAPSTSKNIERINASNKGKGKGKRTTYKYEDVAAAETFKRGRVKERDRRLSDAD